MSVIFLWNVLSKKANRILYCPSLPGQTEILFVALHAKIRALDFGSDGLLACLSMAKQLEFHGFKRPGDAFGGHLLTSHPKSKRPLESKFPIHLTLRARRSVLKTPKNFRAVGKIIKEVARKYGVRIYSSANVGNHLHLALKLSHINRWAGFIRELTGRLALKLKTDEEGFWLYRPHTRIIRGWRKAFKIVKDYIELNRLEAEGFINRRETKTLADLRAIFDG